MASRRFSREITRMYERDILVQVSWDMVPDEGAAREKGWRMESFEDKRGALER